MELYLGWVLFLSGVRGEARGSGQTFLPDASGQTVSLYTDGFRSHAQGGDKNILQFGAKPFQH